MYWFPHFEIGKQSKFSEALDAKREKDHNGEWKDDMGKMLGFDWKSNELLPLPTSSPTCTLDDKGKSLPLQLPGFGGDALQVPDQDEPPSEHDKADLSAILGEVNRTNANALKIISAGEALLSKSLSPGEADLTRSVVEQLIKVAQEADEICVPLARAVKYQRVSLEGGYTKANIKILHDQGSDVLSRLVTCSKMVRAISHTSKAPHGP